MKNTAIFLIYAFISFTTLAGCKKAGGEEPQVRLSAESNLNVSYGSNTRQVMDVYLPEGRNTETPVIVLVHGGSWVEGDKSSLGDLAKYWRDRGYAAVSINYRLTNTAEGNVHPAQVNDIGKAIDFISSKSNEWKVANDVFALQGASAGAHLSLLYSYKYNQNNKVKAVISMAGPTDLSKIQQAGPALAQVVVWLIGSSYQANPTAYVQASPVSHVNSQSVPTLLFHGKLDAVVPYQQSEELKQKLDDAGAKSKLVLYADTGHEVLNLTNTASFLSDCEAWFDLYLK